MDGIKVLAFDTGGTILDWHSGIVRVLAESATGQSVWAPYEKSVLCVSARTAVQPFIPSAASLRSEVACSSMS